MKLKLLSILYSKQDSVYMGNFNFYPEMEVIERPKDLFPPQFWSNRKLLSVRFQNLKFLLLC